MDERADLIGVVVPDVRLQQANVAQIAPHNAQMKNAECPEHQTRFTVALACEVDQYPGIDEDQPDAETLYGEGCIPVVSAQYHAQTNDDHRTAKSKVNSCQAWPVRT